ncbi:hypothetical protein U1Q18_034104 [Sarracenia purpurea var. burkii]
MNKIIQGKNKGGISEFFTLALDRNARFTNLGEGDGKGLVKRKRERNIPAPLLLLPVTKFMQGVKVLIMEAVQGVLTCALAEPTENITNIDEDIAMRDGKQIVYRDRDGDGDGDGDDRYRVMGCGDLAGKQRGRFEMDAWSSNYFI